MTLDPLITRAFSSEPVTNTERFVTKDARDTNAMPASNTPTVAKNSGSLEVLLVDDEPDLRDLLEEALIQEGYRVTTAADGAEALGKLAHQMFDVVLCDVRLPKVDGLELLRHLRTASPNTNVIMMTAYAEVPAAVLALKEGAYDYLTKPFDIDELLLQVSRILETLELKRELVSIRSQLATGLGANGTQLVGNSPPIKRVKDMVRMVSQSDAPALITGESGTGKELVARMIHEASPRAKRPFVVLNCGALAENLIEAELFGHERGAFTGAVNKRDGRFKAADGGTLFLDEIGELPLQAQVKLLRVLQEGTFEPLGSNTTIKVDVRIVSATHRNLRDLIKTAAFREDLYYRINVIEIPLPPLRDRSGDMPLLLRHLLERFSTKGSDLPSLTPAAWLALKDYEFPGNVREFQHAIEHATVLSGGQTIDVEHLPVSITHAVIPRSPQLAPYADGAGAELKPLSVAVREFERAYLERALVASGGKRAKAAELLGIARKTFWEKMR